MSRQAREKAGRRAETLASFYLRSKGYSILGRRLKTHAGEIDILARRGQTLVVIEVKSRPDLTSAEESLKFRDWVRISEAANIHISRHQNLQKLALRFDAVFVIGGWKILHHKDFWRPH